jgi:hypothetical protein
MNLNFLIGILILLISIFNSNASSVLNRKRQTDNDVFEVKTYVREQYIINNYGDNVEISCKSNTTAYDLDIIWLNPNREVNSLKKFF